MDSIELLISIIAGIITVIIAAIEFVKWLSRRSAKSHNPLQVFVKEGNIYGNYEDGSTRQLSHQSADLNPILIKSKSKVIFFRAEKVKSEREYTRFKLMTLDLRKFEEETLSDQKPYLDGLEGSFEIIQPRSPSLSDDQSKLLFTIEKYATGSQLVQVDIKSGKWIELFSAEHFDIIRSGKLKGKLLVGVSEVRDKGRDIYYKVCDYNGNVIKSFANYEEYMIFRGASLVREQ